MKTVSAASILILTFMRPALASDLPQLVAVKTRGAPVMDGKLNDACWENAAKTGAFHLTGGAAKANVQTTVMLTYDDESLFVGFRCDEPALQLLKKGITQHDAPVQKDDSVELFIQPAADGDYFHMMVSCQGVTAEQRCVPGGLRDRAWDPQLNVKTGRGQGWWSIELAVPWREMGIQPCLGANLRANFCRNRHAGGKTVYSSWSPLVAFHDNSKFGLVSGFVLDPPGRRLAKIRVVSAQIPDSLAGGSSVAVTAESALAQTAETVVELTVQEHGKARHRHRLPLKLNSGKSGRATFELKNLEPGEHSFEVKVFGGDGKEAIYASPVARRNLSRMLTAYLDRSYYTREKEAVFWMELEPAPEGSTQASVTVTAKDNPEKLLFRLQPEIRNGNGAARIPLEQFGIGKYTVACSIQGQALQASELLTKLAPAAKEVKTDRRLRSMLVDGKPFFPVGILMPPEESFRELAAAGFNTVVRWHGVKDVESILRYMKAAERCGLQVIDTYGGRAGMRARYSDSAFPQKFEQLLDVLRRDIPKEKVQSSLLSYYSLDEPSTVHRPQVRKAYELFNRLDPYHPVTLLTIKRINPALVDFCDVAAVDAYWSPYRSQTPLVVSASADECRSLVESRRLPFLMVILCGAYSGAIRELTPAEQRCQTYLAVIHGARGILWFVYRPMSGLLWNEVKKLSSEMREYGPMLLSGGNRQMFKSEDGAVHALAMSHEGKTRIIAVNVRPYPVQCSFRVGKASTSERQLTIYGTTHIKLDAAFTRGDKLSINSKVMKAQEPQFGRVRPQLNIAGNLVKNPSFEVDADRSGTPDDWKFEAWNPAHKGSLQSQANTGARSICIDKPNRVSASQFISEWITLSPETAYVLQYHIKTELVRGPREFGHATVVLMDSRNKYPYDRKIAESLKVYGSTDWRIVQARFTTGERPAKIRVWCRLYSKVTGKAWFDDIYLGKASDFGRSSSVENLIFNGSFETATNPDTPDGWFYHDHPGRQLIDPATAAHGKQSLRMEVNHGIYSSYYHGAPIKAGETHTYSISMKSDVESYPIHLRFSGVHPYPHIKIHEKNVKLTTEWKRYTFTLTINKKARAMVRIHLSGKKGQVWVDGVQCELGKEAHDYVARKRPGAGH